MKKILLILAYIDTIAFIAIVYHEKILNTVDLVMMPVDQEICKNFPFQFSKC